MKKNRFVNKPLVMVACFTVLNVIMYLTIKQCLIKK